MTKRLLIIIAALFAAGGTAYSQEWLDPDHTLFHYDSLYFRVYYNDGYKANVVAPLGDCYDNTNGCYGDYTKPHGAINIPSTIEVAGVTYTVTGIADGAFAGCTDITSIHIPSTVIAIGEYAFSGCNNIHSIELPNSIQYCDSYAFYGEKNIYVIYGGDRNLHFYDNVILCKYAENGLYYADSAKTTLNGGSLSLTAVNVPNTVTTIRSWAFYGQSGITSVSIPSSVRHIGYVAFACPDLTTVNWDMVSGTYSRYDDSYYVYDAFRFEVDNGTWIAPIAHFNIGEHARRIPDNLLNGDSLLTELTIPATLDSIGASAFYGTGLTSLTLPHSIKYIGAEAFACPNLTTLHYDVVTPADSYDRYGRRTGSSISPYALKMRIGLNDEAVYATDPISQLTIGEHVRYFPPELLSGDSLLTELSIPATLDSIGASAFYGTGLTSLTLPHTLKYVGEKAFASCPNLTTLEFDAELAPLQSSDEYYYNPKLMFEGSPIATVTIGDHGSVPDYFLYRNRALRSLTISDSVRTIGRYAFSGDTNLTTLTLPLNIDTIEGKAFYDTRLTEVTIPPRMKYLGNEAFANIPTLATINYNATNASHNNDNVFGASSPYKEYYDDESERTVYDSIEVAQQHLYIGSNVKSLPTAIFAEMNIESVALPDSLEDIGEEAFGICRNLTNITIPSSVKQVGRYAFYSCSNLQEVLFLDGDSAFTEIGDMAFSRSGLSKVTLGNTVKSIGNRCFEDVSTLRRVVIGPNVVNIGAAAFSGMTNPDTIFVLAQVPPTITATTFERMPTNAKVMVPCGTLQDYQDAPYWNSLTRMAEDPSCYMLITATPNDANMGSVSGGGRYSLGNVATLTAAPRMGYAFAGWADGATDNPRLVLVNGSAQFTANFASGAGAVHDTVWQQRIDTIYIATDTVVLYDTLVVYDTIVVHDTVVVENQAIDAANGLNIRITSGQGRIEVEGALGQSVLLYDLAGRLLRSVAEAESRLTLEVPASGTYLLRVGTLPARKLTVLR
ncbi:MAG: leucine-rich repeat domain-containing protein [Bacteroidales bacterium]|nr:leucine-rich repeat domain-containing protein [Bacteroidales bacterium]